MVFPCLWSSFGQSKQKEENPNGISNKHKKKREVEEIAIESDQCLTKKVIIDNVLERWNTWDSLNRLTNIFNTKCRIMPVVIEAEGRLDYKMPRSGENVTHKHEPPTYIPKKLISTPSTVCF